MLVGQFLLNQLHILLLKHPKIESLNFFLEKDVKFDCFVEKVNGFVMKIG